MEEFIQELPPSDQAKVAWTLDLLEELGVELREPYTKHLKGDLWELRTQNIRILYFLHRGAIVLLHAFKKKTMKTPREDIELALRRMRDCLEGWDIS